MNPDDSISLYYLGMCNQKLSNFVSAAKFLKNLLKLIHSLHAHYELALTIMSLVNLER